MTTIYQAPFPIKILLLVPVLAHFAFGFICGVTLAPFISGFKVGHKWCHQVLVLDDLE